MTGLFANRMGSASVFWYPSFSANAYSRIINTCFTDIEIIHISLLLIGICDGTFYRLGIQDGDSIKLISKTGQIECHAKLWEGARPGTIAKCYGQGHWAYGRVAAKEFGKAPRGGNNNVIIPADYDRLSGSTAFYAVTRVKIVKV